MTGSMPPWWPRGAEERLVRECNCDFCQRLVDALEESRSGVAIDGEHAPLAAFAGGGESA